MQLPWQWWAVVWVVALIAATANGNGDCEDITIWAEKTKFRNVPVTLHRQWMTYYWTEQFLTEFVVSTQSIPYFVTQTQVIPRYLTKVATLPQHITHSIYSTHVHTSTYSLHSYYTVTLELTETSTATVCPAEGVHH